MRNKKIDKVIVENAIASNQDVSSCIANVMQMVFIVMVVTAFHV